MAAESESSRRATNQATVVGRVVADPELTLIGEKETPKARFRIASDNGRAGTLFIDVETFGRASDPIMSHLSKGRQVAVSGRLGYDQWEREDGTKASRHYINATDGGVEFLDRPADRSDQARSVQSTEPAGLGR